MIVCDYCSEPIEQDQMTVTSGMTSGMTVPLHLQLHLECVPLFAQQAKTIRGKRPATPPVTPPGGGQVSH